MPVVVENPWRGIGLCRDAPQPKVDPSEVAAMLAQCPAHRETPLTASPALAAVCDIKTLWIKDERQRMGLGSFKALGAAFAIARDAAEAQQGDLRWALTGQTYVTASAGNHGLSVAAGARVFGARAVVYVAETVPEAFGRRLASYGAEVVREGADYAASMDAAERAALANGWTLLSDSSWPGYTEPSLRVMEGYLQLAAEMVCHVDAPPTHLILQAGVGGMAAAIAAHARDVWGDQLQIIVVEPDRAPALLSSVQAGRIVTADGPDSSMGRLDCKTPSLVAFRGLSRDADLFATVTEDEALAGVTTLAKHGFDTTPSGGAGLAALIAGLNLGAQARVLTILSEGPEDG